MPHKHGFSWPLPSIGPLSSSVLSWQLPSLNSLRGPLRLASLKRSNPRERWNSPCGTHSGLLRCAAPSSHRGPGRCCPGEGSCTENSCTAEGTAGGRQGTEGGNARMCHSGKLPTPLSQRTQGRTPFLQSPGAGGQAGTGPQRDPLVVVTALEETRSLVRCCPTPRDGREELRPLPCSHPSVS